MTFKTFFFPFLVFQKVNWAMSVIKEISILFLQESPGGSFGFLSTYLTLVFHPVYTAYVFWTKVKTVPEAQVFVYLLSTFSLACQLSLVTNGKADYILAVKKIYFHH